MNYTAIHDLIMKLTPPLTITVGPGDILTLLTLTGWAIFEWTTWKKHR